MRLEKYFNGRGARFVTGYASLLSDADGGSSYLARNYTALGLSYEVTPLLNADMLVMANLKDDSMLWSINAVYSLSNESELALGIGLPMGKGPEGANILSEFGMYPDSISIEVRYYF